jgi:hypothetical protein
MGGWAAPVAGVSLARSCPACGDKDYLIAEPSRLIDAAAWDGSDLFIVWPLPGYKFASSRLASILRKEKISGVQLISAPKIPVKRGATLGPASITYCMPEDRRASWASASAFRDGVGFAQRVDLKAVIPS